MSFAGPESLSGGTAAQAPKKMKTAEKKKRRIALGKRPFLSSIHNNPFRGCDSERKSFRGSYLMTIR